MGERKGLWAKEKAGSKISVTDKRLRRYVNIHAKKQAFEKTKRWFLKGSANTLNEDEAIVTVAEASRRALETTNGAGNSAAKNFGARLADYK